MRKITTLFCLFVGSLLFISCKGEKAEEKTQTVSEQVLKYAMDKTAGSFDPGVSFETFSFPVLSNTFVGLVGLTEEGQIVPKLAKDWDMAEDGLTYTFHLKDNLLWSDGTPLTASDFVYAWTRVMTPDTASQNPKMMYAVVKNGKDYYEGNAEAADLGLSAPDEKTFVVDLETTSPHFLTLLTAPLFCPVKEEVVSENPAWSTKAETYISSGPFKMTTFDKDKLIVLERNEHYYDNDSVVLDKVEIIYITDVSTALGAVQKEDVDAVYTVPAADIPTLKIENEGFRSKPVAAIRYYNYNTQSPAFSDPRVRRAFALAIDRESIITDVLQSDDIPAMKLIPPGLTMDGKDFYAADDNNYGLTVTANLEEARELMAEAGYPNGEGFPEVDLKYYTAEDIKKLTEAMAQMWEEGLGVTCKISNKEWPVFFEEVQKLDYDIAAMGNGSDYPHPLALINTFAENELGAAMLGYNNPEYDALVRVGNTSTDLTAGFNALQQAEDIFMADMPILPIIFRTKPYICNPYVKGLYLDGYGTPKFEKASIER